MVSGRESLLRRTRVRILKLAAITSMGSWRGHIAWCWLVARFLVLVLWLRLL